MEDIKVSLPDRSKVKESLHKTKEQMDQGADE